MRGLGKQPPVAIADTHAYPLLTLLRRTAADAARSIDPDRSPILAGWCTDVAMLVRAVAGGDLIEGSVRRQPHYWNRLPDGSEVDLTSDQFGGDGWAPMARGTIVDVPDLIPLRSLLFARRVLRELAA